ncbi:MAG: 1-acyl-sn-glycerol-3-phosphate acyltransferase [Acidobacteria bacterium]|nr:1-acyl-sn-glycerol-3-phosphate acyltransferase [Acidobacteriota bacterium]
MLRRAVALGMVLGAAVVRYWMRRVRGALTLERRAQWLHETCVRVLRSMGIRVEVEGEIPTRGLVVANHLSYLDVVILSAAMPCLFVAKSEIDDWPYFGRAARAGGTLFIDRSRKASTEKVGALISERLELQVPVLFFPEGTSTDGTMLKFHSSLFEPAIRERATVTAAAIRYVMDDGTPERTLCWFGDEKLVPHLVRTLKSAGFHARLRFGEQRVYQSRREAANETSLEIAGMREGRVVRNQLVDAKSV